MDAADEDLQELLLTLDPTTRTLVAEVDLGNQARDFMRSELGRHLIGCLNQEIILAQDELNKVLFWRIFKVKELQNQIWRAQFMLNWLRDLILSGKSADGALQESEHGE